MGILASILQSLEQSRRRMMESSIPPTNELLDQRGRGGIRILQLQRHLVQAIRQSPSNRSLNARGGELHYFCSLRSPQGDRVLNGASMLKRSELFLNHAGTGILLVHDGSHGANLVPLGTHSVVRDGFHFVADSVVEWIQCEPSVNIRCFGQVERTQWGLPSPYFATLITTLQ
jgi:hypothetical protein